MAALDVRPAGGGLTAVDEPSSTAALLGGHSSWVEAAPVRVQCVQLASPRYSIRLGTRESYRFVAGFRRAAVAPDFGPPFLIAVFARAGAALAFVAAFPAIVAPFCVACKSGEADGITVDSQRQTGWCP